MKYWIIAFLLTTVKIQAQEMRHHEWSVSFGYFDNILDKRFDDFTLEMCRKYGLNPDKRYTHILEGRKHQTISLQYHYRISHSFSVGATVGWGHALHHYGELKLLHPLIPFPAGMKRKVHMHSHTLYIAPSMRWTWYELRSHWLRLYSSLSVGVIRQKMEFRPVSLDNAVPLTVRKWRMTYQVTPVGLEFGKRAFRGFAELGYGYQSVFNTGLRIAL